MDIKILENLYVRNKLSVREVSRICSCSQSKVNYWLKKNKIQKRSISSALYLKNNPFGDPFKLNYPSAIDAAILYGIGLGLYWGEGTKSNKYAIRLGNTNPRIISKFVEFLVKVYSIDPLKLRFGLQVFSDIAVDEALNYWVGCLDVSRSQFYRPVVTPARGRGNYRIKLKYGVLTVYFHNKKLRDVLCGALEKL